MITKCLFSCILLPLLDLEGAKAYEWNLLDGLASATLPSAIEVSKGQGVWLQKEISYIKMFLNAVYFILKF